MAQLGCLYLQPAMESSPRTPEYSLVPAVGVSHRPRCLHIEYLMMFCIPLLSYILACSKPRLAKQRSKPHGQVRHNALAPRQYHWRRRHGPDCTEFSKEEPAVLDLYGGREAHFAAAAGCPTGWLLGQLVSAASACSYDK